MASRKIIYPETLVKIIKLWPWARSKGYFIGQIWEVGYYSKRDGLDFIWLCDDKERRYTWSVDRAFLEKYFVVKEESKNRRLYMPLQNSKKRWISLEGEIVIGIKRTGKFMNFR
jgi:hypothetical protein